MAHVGLCGNALPVAASGLQKLADLGIEVGAHAGIIAKFCDEGKQPIALDLAQSCAMESLSLNQTLAKSLARAMAEKGGRGA